MLIIDSHLDLAWNALQWNRNLFYSVYTIRVLEAKTPGPGRAQNTVAFPEMRQARIAVSFATLLARSTGMPEPHIDYATPYQAYGIAQGQLAYYRALEQDGHIRLLKNASELDRHIAEWEAFEQSGDTETPPLGIVLSMESADPILSPAQLEEWWNAGLRLLGVAHFGQGRYTGGTGVENGLGELGRELISEMSRLGIALDLTHYSDNAFWQALERFEGPVLASHNNCRTLVPHQRQFSDEQIKAIIERDGVIGAAFDCWMLQPGWIVDHSSNRDVSLENVVDHIDHICQLSGNCLHAGIGSDLDGGFGRDQSPADLDTIIDLQKLAGIFEKRGYRPDDIAQIMHGNWLRFLRKAWS